ncbi:MAG: VWA domain-containing protein, partial [Anaerolineae bacterium]|nr:VWA domain-containing protein [Anaerolineae bacterium]
SYVPFSRDPAPEVQVTDVRVPQEVGANQEFDLSFTVQSEAATDATVTVLAAGEILLRDNVTLRAGENNYAVSLQSGEAGFRDFQVRVDPVGGDAFHQNNQLAAFSEVVGPPRVLLVSQDAAEGQYVIDALNQVGIAVDQVTPGQLPVGITPLTSYDSVILANVPATMLTQRRMQTLSTYVRDLGGGLVVIGGPDTYAPGGYFQTPLEEALPVEMQIRDQQRLPQLTLVYVIDRSGSMGVAGANGIANIELAKEAMIRSVEFLQPSDRAGVISFDTDAAWIAEIQPVFDRFGLQALIGTLRASGGTDIEAGYNLAAEAMIADPSPRKHIILLTDGGAAPGNLVESAAQLFQDYDVTTTVISIGSGVNFLSQMAQSGGGNYHEVVTVEQIPTIFASETVLASRAYIVEESFVPLLSANSPIMDGITSAPPLLGYVASTPKQTAQVILRSPEPFADPILATWQYGL